MIVISHTEEYMGLLEEIVDTLRKHHFDVRFRHEADSLEWFDDADDARVCLLWITRKFVATACGLHSHRLQSQMVMPPAWHCYWLMLTDGWVLTDQNGSTFFVC